MNTIAYIKILYRGIHSYFIVVGYIKKFLATYILIIRKDQVDDESQQRDNSSLPRYYAQSRAMYFCVLRGEIINKCCIWPQDMTSTRK